MCKNLLKIWQTLVRSILSIPDCVYFKAPVGHWCRNAEQTVRDAGLESGKTSIVDHWYMELQNEK